MFSREELEALIALVMFHAVQRHTLGPEYAGVSRVLGDSQLLKLCEGQPVLDGILAKLYAMRDGLKATAADQAVCLRGTLPD